MIDLTKPAIVRKVKVPEYAIAKGCDFCGKAYTNFIYDARTWGGYWAWLCSRCYEANGIKLGVGFGQKYDINTREKLEG